VSLEAVKDAFGIYCGDHDGKFVVVLKEFWTWNKTTCEIYDTLEELKQVRELD
jgi:hypothetical protein